MKQLLFFPFALLFFCLNTFAQTKEVRYKNASALYDKGDYASSIRENQCRIKT
ncbi:hypothetical protein [Ferruginibacter sp.]